MKRVTIGGGSGGRDGSSGKGTLSAPLHYSPKTECWSYFSGRKSGQGTWLTPPPLPSAPRPRCSHFGRWVILLEGNIGGYCDGVARSIPAAVNTVRALCGFSVKCEVQCGSSAATGSGPSWGLLSLCLLPISLPNLLQSPPSRLPLPILSGLPLASLLEPAFL